MCPSAEIFKSVLRESREVKYSLRVAMQQLSGVSGAVGYIWKSNPGNLRISFFFFFFFFKMFSKEQKAKGLNKGFASVVVCKDYSIKV